MLELVELGQKRVDDLCQGAISRARLVKLLEVGLTRSASDGSFPFIAPARADVNLVTHEPR